MVTLLLNLCHSIGSTYLESRANPSIEQELSANVIEQELSANVRIGRKMLTLYSPSRHFCSTVDTLLLTICYSIRYTTCLGSKAYSSIEHEMSANGGIGRKILTPYSPPRHFCSTVDTLLLTICYSIRYTTCLGSKANFSIEKN